MEASHQRVALGILDRPDVNQPARGIEGDGRDHAYADMRYAQSAFMAGALRPKREGAVASALAHPEQAIRPECQAARKGQVAGTLALTAEEVQETAFPVEHADVMRL